MIDAEPLGAIVDTNDHEILLTKLPELIQESKQCVTDLNKQQVM